jgi:hypothetical protein
MRGNAVFGSKSLRQFGQGHVTIRLNPRSQDVAIR